MYVGRDSSGRCATSLLGSHREQIHRFSSILSASIEFISFFFHIHCRLSPCARNILALGHTSLTTPIRSLISSSPTLSSPGVDGVARHGDRLHSTATSKSHRVQDRRWTPAVDLFARPGGVRCRVLGSQHGHASNDQVRQAPAIVRSCSSRSRGKWPCCQLSELERPLLCSQMPQ